MAKTILVVDDELTLRSFLEKLLRSQGYQVITASDGLMGLEKVAAVQPDLVLLDVMMPHLNGFEVCQIIKGSAETRLTPVVLITGLGVTEDRIRGLEAGANDFLTKPFDRSELLARVRSLLALKAATDELESAESVVFALSRSIEGKDPYTEGHCERLSEYSVRLGERIGLPADEMIAVRRAGIVHDIGKVAVPEAILLKPGKLTAVEWKIMQEHPVVGERICAPLKSFRLVLPIIRHHHEKMDGSGYPDGLENTQIPLTARVLQTVDIFDALTTDRPYRKAMSTQNAFTVMHEEVKQGWWDGWLVDELETTILDTPPAELVQPTCSPKTDRGRMLEFLQPELAFRNKGNNGSGYSSTTIEGA